MNLTEFETLKFLERLRGFYNANSVYIDRPNTDYLAMRVFREPGVQERIIIAAGMGNAEHDAIEEIYEWVNPDEFEELRGAPFAKVFIECMFDAFCIPSIDESTPNEDVVAEELFEHFLSTGLILLAKSPYVELHVAFTPVDGGMTANYTLVRTSVQDNAQINTILIQSTYPLASVEKSEHSEEMPSDEPTIETQE